VPADDAREAASHCDDTMKRCILRLYRSAVVVGREWAPELVRLPPPGLVLWGETDPYADASWGRRLANATGAQLVVLPACSHWWQLERPDAVVAQLHTLWRAR
jgi:pimeloyl-ACP methyl ester carboxylesterase